MNSKYQYAIKDENYEDYSSGRVLYGTTGATNFPVRLSSEVFQQCAQYLADKGKMGPYKIYDPFCGVAYSLTVIGFIHGSQVKSLIASDSDSRILEFAQKNLSLLTKEGMGKRIDELKKFIEDYKKDSHKEALESAYRLQSLTQAKIKIQSFQFNTIEDNDFPETVSEIDMVITDLPYGKLTEWDGIGNEENFAQQFLNKLKDKLDSTSVIAIIYDKKQVIMYEGYKLIKSYKLGKRKITLLELEK